MVKACPPISKNRGFPLGDCSGLTKAAALYTSALIWFTLEVNAIPRCQGSASVHRTSFQFQCSRATVVDPLGVDDLSKGRPGNLFFPCLNCRVGCCPCTHHPVVGRGKVHLLNAGDSLRVRVVRRVCVPVEDVQVAPETKGCGKGNWGWIRIWRCAPGSDGAV